MTNHDALKAAGRAIRELDRASFVNKDKEDMEKWQLARTCLFDILERNGYEIAAYNSPRIRKKK